MSKSESSRHRVPPYKRPLIIGIFLLILSAVIITTVLICKNFLKPNESHLTKPQDNPGDSQPVIPSETEPANPDNPVENKTPQYEGEDPNDLDELTGHIIYKDIDPETNTLHTSVMINQFLQSGGQCVYNIKRDDAILRTASGVAFADVTTSVCGPFSISLEGLSPGNYQLEVTITGDDKRGVILDELQI